MAKQDMAETEQSRRQVSRRSFLKGSLAAGALAAGGSAYLTGCAPKSAADNTGEMAETGEPVEVNEEIYSGVCRGNCYGGCFLNVHVRDGKVVRTSARDLPEPEWNRICAKGLSHVFRIYDPERVKYPMRRVGERGAGEWEQISWDEALEEIAIKYKQFSDEFGPESNMYWGGSGNFAIADNYSRFWNLIGASNVSQTLDMAIFYGSQKCVGVSMNFNGNELTDLVNAKTIVIWGANPAVSQMQGMHFILEARDAGAKTIAIDPIYTTTVSKCDQWIPINSGTDGLLAMALMNIIIEKGWQGVDYLKSTTVAPFLVKESDGTFLRLSDLGQSEAGSDMDAIVVTDGKGMFATPDQIAEPVIEGSFDANGQKVTCAYTLLLERLAMFSVDDAVEQTGIDRATMEALAEDLAVNTPSTIYIALGIDHYDNGGYSIFDICCLAALTGCAGTPGSFYGTSEQIVGFFTNPAGQYGAMTEQSIGSKYSIPIPKLKEVIDTQTFKGEPLAPKSLYIYRTGGTANMCNRQAVLEALDKLEFIVVADMAMTEIGKHADLILPVAHWFEQEDVAANGPQNPFVQYQEKAIDPLYEAKSDFDIVKALADKMGYGELFGFTVADYIDDVFNVEPFISQGVTYADLVEKKAIRGVPGSSEKPFIHGEGGFPTATGRIQFYDEAPGPNVDYGQEFDLTWERLPYWRPAREVGLGNDKYPLQILSDHQKLRTHTQWINIPAILELDPEPTVRMNSVDAEARGLAEGDYGRIYNDRGSCTMKVHISDGVKPGILLCSRGWYEDQFVDGHFQDLLQNELDTLCVNQTFFDNVGEIEKVEA